MSETYQSGIMDGMSGAVTACQNNAVALKIKEATKQGDSINLAVPDSKTRRGRVGGLWHKH